MISYQFILHTVFYGLLICLCVRQRYQLQVNEITSRSLTEVSTTTDITIPSGNSWKSLNVWIGNHSIGLRKGHSFSQVGQDLVVSTLLRCLKEGFFIDLAANDATRFSNTAMLESTLHWNGICIEPNPKYWKRLAYRKCQFVGAVVGAHDDDVVSFLFNDVFGGIQGLRNGKYGNPTDSKGAKMEKSPVISFTSLLQNFNAPSIIDYLSLDIEGAETLAMKAFPFHAYKIRVITVERPDQELQKLLKENGYIFALKLGGFGEQVYVHESEAHAMGILSKLPNFGIQQPDSLYFPSKEVGGVFYNKCGVDQSRH